MINKNTRNLFIVKMYDKGELSLEELAKVFKLKRQTVFEIYHREKAMKGKKLPKSLNNKYPNLTP